MLEIKVTGSTHVELMRNFKYLFKEFCEFGEDVAKAGLLTSTAERPLAEVTREMLAKAETPEVAEPQKKKPGRPPKNKTESTTQPSKNPPAEESEDSQLEMQLEAESKTSRSEPIPELPEVRATVQKVIDAKGIATAFNIIKEFGQTKYTQIPKEQWPKLMRRCEEVIGG